MAPGGDSPTWFWWLVLLFVGCASPGTAGAQVSKEYQIKGVCLWRLAQFVTWPTNAFDSADIPLIIGVLGDNPFGGILHAAVKDETAHGRKLLVQNYRSVNEAKSCHILFVSASEAGQINRILRELSGKSILTVADFEGFARSKGGMIGLLTQRNRVKLRVNLKAVDAAGLRLDSRLLRAAEVINEN